MPRESHDTDGADTIAERRGVAGSGSWSAVVEDKVTIQGVDLVKDPVQQVGVADHFPQVEVSVVAFGQSALRQLRAYLADV